MIVRNHIDLHLPSSWNIMSVQELETVARIMTEETVMNASHPERIQSSVRTRLFLELNGLEIQHSSNDKTEADDSYIRVRKRGRVYRFFHRKDTCFRIYIWQMDYWMRENLKWMDQPCTLTRFPYPTLSIRGKHFQGASSLMQNFSWRQYRFACDYLSYYLLEENQLLNMLKSGKRTPEELKVQQSRAEEAKSMFLATIFNGKVRTMDSETGRSHKQYAYVSSQSERNARYFRRFPDYKFQVILFWWSGMMNYLQGKYPKCFKKSNPKKQAATNPLELYTRTTATMEKYLGINEEQLNEELYSVVLQHIQDMAVENESMERMRKNK